jgi:hypothetical protein
MKFNHRLILELSVIISIITYFFSTLWLIPWMIFGLLYQPISWISLDWLLTPFLFITIISLFLFWYIIFKRKSKTFKSIIGQDLILIVIGLPFSNTFLSVFKLDVDGGLTYPMPFVLIAVLTFLIVQINHRRKL